VCSSDLNDAADARLVAAELGIPLYVCNFKKDFGRIIDYFVDEYAEGRTPNPCVRCNDWLKFGKLHDYAKQIGATHVASGHYARIDHTARNSQDHAHGPRLLRGIDYAKDQSYVLFGAPREKLSEMLLPIGGYEKPHVREMAKEFGLPTFDKPDSQEICFVPDNDYASLIERKRPELVGEGEIKDEAGNVVGTHKGQHHFTIGQRRGTGVALGYPIYVINKDPRTNTVTVGDEQNLYSAHATMNEANWLTDPPSADWFPVLARYRYNGVAVPARARIAGDSESETHSGRTGTFEVRFDEPQRAVAPGQAMVLYDAKDSDVVLGGGWITETGSG